MNDFVHMHVYLTGRCTKCKYYSELLVYDYGKMTYEQQDAEMDHVNHPIVPIPCSKCGAEYPAEHIVYREMLRKVDAVKQAINHDYIDPETSAAILEGHEKRFEIFADREKEFWSAFTDYALDNWQASVAELSRVEVAAGFVALGQSPTLKSDLHARREAQKVAQADRRSFWQAANAKFVKELLDIGAMGWVPIDYTKHFGPARTRFGIMYFPIAESQEDLRTKYIGLLFKRERGDNAFLLRRVGQLTDTAHKQTVKYNKLLRLLDEQKHTIATFQDKLGVANAKIASLSEQQPITERSKDDIRRIRELKSFVGELLAELRKLRPDESEDVQEPPVLVEDAPDTQTSPLPDLSDLEGKTVSIIGGYRSRERNGYPCNIIVHDGRKHNPHFYAALQQADIIVVLRLFVSHASMWEAKAFAAQEDKPIYYVQEINIRSILNIVAKKNQQEVNLTALLKTENPLT
ncbi:DUF2325 domain-containing protein [Paenibacillus terrae]|uniref:DUF2325 domain-containing protein n=1 Tax=Paenibacillus terrae TaxID=159743 RepID=A0A0D7WZZ3_9BACL|nr:DUF2325 domain-containing protein [Paenibacillus terrae]KJD43312.1 hypothetical protein QD47_23440 [Paenibacillus terrae]